MSQKPLLYVSRITNLSDARYSAGMGVDLLGFYIDSSHDDYVSPAQYQEMIGWVAGPKRVIEVTLSNPVDMDKVIDQYKPEFIHLRYEDIKNYTLDLPVILEMSFKEWSGHGDKLAHSGINIAYLMITDLPDPVTTGPDFTTPYPVLLRLEKDIKEPTSLLEKTKANGFALQGSKELAPGLKDYDHLSTILEKLDSL